MKTKSIIASLLLAAFVPVAVAAPGEDKKPVVSKAKAGASDSHVAAARELLVVTKTAELSKQVMTSVMQPMREALPQVPPEYWKELQAEMKGEELVELCIPAYTKHLTEEEIREIIKFYKSPIGRKLIEKQPLIMMDTMAIGQEWGRKLGERILKRLRDDGHTA